MRENSYGSTISCPHQPPSQRLRVEAVVGPVEDGLLVGVVALAKPLGLREVGDAGLGAAAGPEGEGDAPVSRIGREEGEVMGCGASRLHTFGSPARFQPPHLWCLVGCDRCVYWLGRQRRRSDAPWTLGLQREGAVA